MRKEFRIIGPPGCGKTTYLAGQVSRAVEAGRRPLITSLTKAAALEIGSRVQYDYDFGEDQVGTLHAHCFRALGRPALIETAEQLKDWNDFAIRRDPTWELSLSVFGTSSAKDGESQYHAPGDSLYHQATIHRARLDRDDLIPTSCARFMRAFSDWRNMSKLHDFTALVERCFAEIEDPPESPDVIIVDEAQDHDRLELSLVRKWAAHESVDMLIVSGDPDQNLYEFRGAEPEAFYSGEAAKTIALEQSYRVPERVHREAVAMIRRIEDRVDVPYHPTRDRGEVYRSALSLAEPHRIVARAESCASRGESVMILATCEYMLRGLIKSLRLAGLPFHNPYAPNRGAFNPIGERRGVSSPRRLLSFLKPSRKFFGDDAKLWTWGELAQWVEPLTVKGFLRHGAKTKLVEFAETNGERLVTVAELRPFLDAETGAAELRKIDADPLAWYLSRLTAAKIKPFEYPVEIVRRHGVRAIEAVPKIVVGTIHSVKGGEADHVLLFPDLSPQGREQLGRNPSAVIRSFYVGMTRAKRTLALGKSSSQSAIKW